MTDIVKCARCGIDVPQKWAFIEEGDEWECPSCWHRCEEKELRDQIERLRDLVTEIPTLCRRYEAQLAEAEALLRKTEGNLRVGYESVRELADEIDAWLARRDKT